MSEHTCSSGWSAATRALFAALFGVGVVLLVLVSGGAVLLPFEALVLLLPLAMLHYALWGHGDSRRGAG